MKLNELKLGRTAVIKEVEAKCNCVLRFMTLGLVEGAKIKFIGHTKHNIEISIYGTRVAISKHCASHIVV